jgi:urease accessory protein
VVAIASAVVRSRAGHARSDVHRARSAGPLRQLTPRAAGNAAWIVTSSLGGGLVDGDHTALDIEIDAGATAVVTTQASTKAYRGSTSQRVALRVGDGATALVVPDPVVPYRGARLVQETRVELAPTASLVLIDVLTCGRVAYGERWAAAIDATLAISRGALLLHDRVVVDGAGPMRDFEALATVILLGPLAKHAGSTSGVLLASSPLGDGVMFRLAATRVELAIRSVRELAREACSAAGEDPWARKW